MIRFLRHTVRKFGGFARRRPFSAVAFTILVVAVAVVGCSYGYFRYQFISARTAVQEGRLQEARGRLDRALTVWPRSVDGHLLAARAARLSGDFEAAESHLNRCKQLQNNEASEATQIEFRLMRVQTGEMDEVANDLFVYVDHQHPESPLILETIARSYMHHLRYRPAFDCLTRWIAETPEAAKPYHLRGWVLERLNQAKAAMNDYDKALALEPGLVEVRLRVVEMLLEDHKTLEAVPHLERLLTEAPDRPAVKARLGQCRYLQNEPAEARKLLEEAVQQLPDDPAVLLHLAKLELDDGRPAAAEPWLRHALAVDSTDTEAQFTLVAALRAQGRRSAAAEALVEYEKKKTSLERANALLKDEADKPSKNPASATEIGTQLLAIGQDRRGLYWLDQALIRDPNHAPAHRALAEYYEKKGDSERAAVHRRRSGS